MQSFSASQRSWVRKLGLVALIAAVFAVVALPSIALWALFGRALTRALRSPFAAVAPDVPGLFVISAMVASFSR